MDASELLDRVMEASSAAVAKAGAMLPTVVGLDPEGRPVHVIMLPHQLGLADRLDAAAMIVHAHGCDTLWCAFTAEIHVVHGLPLPDLSEDPAGTPVVCVAESSPAGCQELVRIVSVGDDGTRQLSDWFHHGYLGGPVHDVLHDVTRRPLTERMRRRTLRRMSDTARDLALHVDPGGGK